jgi:putative DNA primase/helicase
MAVAKQLITGEQHEDGPTRYRWRGDWLRWEGSHWSEIEDASIRAMIYTQLEHAVYKGANSLVPWQPNRHRVSDVSDALAAVAFLRNTAQLNTWLDDSDIPAGELVACANGLLHVSRRKLYEHTPAFFNIAHVPFDYSSKARTPERWLKFLNDLWPGDPDSVAALQQWFGYVISGRTDLHKILLMIGPPRSGKGTIARILRKLIGERNTVGPTLASLEANFGLAPLIGKSLAVISDARLSRGHEGPVVEKLLSISGEDTLTIDRKYKEPWTGPIPARLMIVSNELPKFGDASGAIVNRCIMLQMTQSWLDREDTRLTAKLAEEMPGIMNWALAGLARVVARNSISESDTSATARDILNDNSSPISSFVRDCCYREGEVVVDEVWHAWRTWCAENGHKESSKGTLGRDLHAIIPSLEVVSRRVGRGGGRQRSYVGLSLRQSRTRGTRP